VEGEREKGGEGEGQRRKKGEEKGRGGRRAAGEKGEGCCADIV
jgi:hypothetical protein